MQKVAKNFSECAKNVLLTNMCMQTQKNTSDHHSFNPLGTSTMILSQCVTTLKDAWHHDQWQQVASNKADLLTDQALHLLQMSCYIALLVASVI